MGVGGVARELFVDDEAALAGDEGGVDDVDRRGFGGGDRGREALDEGGVEGFGVGQGGDFAFVDEVEGRARGGLGPRGGGGVRVLVRRRPVRARAVLRVEGAHLFDELDERLQFFVFFRQDEGCVDGAAGELAAQDRKDLFADVDADVLLRFNGRGAEVRGRDDFGVGDEFRGGGVGGWWLGGEDVDAGARDVAAFECVVQGGFVDHAATGDVENPCAFLHGSQFWPADHALGAGDERRVDGEKVRDGKKGWERVDKGHGGGSCERG